MKKLLIATSALAFAGSAFAADVSGYVYSAYQKADKKTDTKLRTYAGVTVSGSKTSSRGLTFGASYDLEAWGQTSAVQAKPNTVTKGEVSTNPLSGVAGVTPTSVEAGAKSQAAYINAFVSGSFGKVQMGRHNTASRALGTDSIAVGKGVINSNAQDGTRHKAVDAITYTSPVFAGAQLAYTMTPGEDAEGMKKAKSMALKYSGNFAGIGLAVVYSTYENMTATLDTKDLSISKIYGSFDKKATAYGFKVTKSAFSVSYSMSKLDDITSIGGGATEDDGKSSRIGVGYAAGKMSVGYSQNKMGKEVKTSVIIAKYTVASGLTAFIENAKTDGAVDEKNNTKMTWIGTTISF